MCSSHGPARGEQALQCEPRWLMVAPRRPVSGTEPSGYSSAGGSGEANNVTGIWARAMHRGQCSITSLRARGLMLSPQRGQFRNSEPSVPTAGS